MVLLLLLSLLLLTIVIIPIILSVFLIYYQTYKQSINVCVLCRFHAVCCFNYTYNRFGNLQYLRSAITLKYIMTSYVLSSYLCHDIIRDDNVDYQDVCFGIPISYVAERSEIFRAVFLRFNDNNIIIQIYYTHTFLSYKYLTIYYNILYAIINDVGDRTVKP